MIQIKYLLFAGFFFAVQLGVSQEKDPLKESYQDAKRLFDQRAYSLAMEAFKPLIQERENNPYSVYASYYYAIAAYREGYLPMAKNMFLQIKELFPEWSKISEVDIWLSHVYFELKDFDQALRLVNKIDQKGAETFAVDLKRYHIAQLDSIDTLKRLHQQFPEDKIIARMLALKIAALPLTQRDQELLEDLIVRFNLNPESLDVPFIRKTVFKDKYRVAVLLPFMVDRLEPTDRPKVNQIILDFYNGLRLAADSLKQAGINIELLAYDTKRNEATTAEILSKEELQQVDLIIGPLFSGPRELVKSFSYEHEINVMNPFFTHADLIAQNPFSFMYNPTNEIIGRQTADYVAEHVKNKVGIIFYGDSEQDSITAEAYKKEIEKDSFNIIIHKKISKENTREILDILLISDVKVKEVSREGGKGKLTIGMDSVGHVFVASADELISTKVVSAVETRGDSIKIVGPASWLESEAINYDTYGRLKAVLYAPSYVVHDTLNYEAFKNNYIKRHKQYPKKEAAYGYDMMMLLAKSLNDYGKYFQLGWQEAGYLPGELTLGYKFVDSRANELLPILEFNKEVMEVLLDKEKNSDGDK
ncbi:MAG: ABC transporter substrate-binding protein [Fulvivirga sp.]|nr:ABC transporter substrate-binding protein [Fulvivirga sp.]